MFVFLILSWRQLSSQIQDKLFNVLTDVYIIFLVQYLTRACLIESQDRDREIFRQEENFIQGKK